MVEAIVEIVKSVNRLFSNAKSENSLCFNMDRLDDCF